MAETEQTPNQETTNEATPTQGSTEATTHATPNQAAPEATTKTGAYSSFVLLMDAHSGLLQQEPTAEEREDYLTAVQNFLKRAQETGAVLENPEERYTAQSLLNYWITVLYRAEIVYSEETTLAPYDPFVSVEIEDERCPYPGVRPFEEDQHKFFFGRQRQINYMLSRLQEDRLLAIVGPSGSGKTSLVLAGLLPEMKQSDRAKNSEHHYFPVITPGSKPLQALSAMFGEAEAGMAAVRADFHKDWTQLLKLVENSTKLPTIMVVDQFHEIFTCANYADRRAFLGNLEKLIDSPDRRHTIIVMMTEVNYESYLRRPERFRKRLDPAKVSLPSLGSLELRDAIEKPGAYVGMKFPDPVVKALVNETMSEPLGLPLLQFMLYKLWDAHKNKEDLQAAFNEMHSCREALASSAAEFFGKLDLRDNVACRRVLKQLVTFDNDFRAKPKPQRRAQLYLHTELNSRVDNLTDRLAENQLVRLTPGALRAEDEVELTHESLLRSWPQMKKWVASLKAQRKRLFVGKVAAAALVAAVAILAISFVVGWRWEVYKSRELARLSKQQLANERFDLALLLGLAAYQTDDNTVSRGTLLRLLHNFLFTPRPERFLSAENYAPQDLAFSLESDRAPGKLAAINGNGKIVIWNLNWEQGSPSTTENLIVEKSTATYPIVFSSDSKIVATASTEANVVAILWDTTTLQWHNLTQGKQVVETNFAPLSAALAFSPKAKLLFSGGPDGNIVQWDVTDSQSPIATPLFAHTSPIRSIAVNGKGDQVAIGDDDGAVLLLDLTNKPVKKKEISRGHTSQFPGDETVYNLAFNQEGSLLAASRASSHSDTATVWNVATGSLQREYFTGLDSGLLIAFTGDELSGFNTSGVVFTWDVARGGLQGDPVYKPLLASTTASFSTRGNFVALPSPNLDGAILWALSPRVRKRDAPVSSIAFKPGETGVSKNTLLIGEGYGIALLPTNLEEYEVPRLQGEGSSVLDVAYNADGSKIAAALYDGTIRVRDTNDLKNEIRLARALTGTKFTDSVKKIVFDPTDVHRLAALMIRSNVENEEVTHEIVLWDTKTASEIQFPKGKPSVDKTFRIIDIVFRNESQLAWASADDKQSKITIWDLRTNTLVKEFPVASEVFCLAFHPTRRVLAAGLGGGTIQVWDVDKGNSYTLKLKVGSGDVTDLTFSPPEGAVLACVTNSPEEERPRPAITLWDVANREQLGDSLKGHQDMISSIAFSSDGNILASGSEDGTVRLWGPLAVMIAKPRFCNIVDCGRTYGKVGENKVANPLDDDSFFQRLYRTIDCRSSLRKTHKVEGPPENDWFIQKLYRRLRCRES